MIVGLLLAGVLAGIAGFVFALVGGAPVWLALLVYTGCGSVAVLMGGLLVAIGNGWRGPALAAAPTPNLAVPRNR